jgi:peptidoglycan/LPS O-acetylase OafA/YrhL
MTLEGERERMVAPSGKNLSIEWLRLLLAAGVVVYHFFWYLPLRGIAGAGPTGPDWLMYGRFGVEAFFIISGYVIAFSMADRSAADFVASRVSRLYPALVLCASLSFLAILARDDMQAMAGMINLVADWLFVPLVAGIGQIDPAYWSIVVELRFYLLVLVLLLLRVSHRLLLLLTVFSVSATSLALFGRGDPWLGWLLFPHASYFALGVLLRHVRTQGVSAFAVAVAALHLYCAGIGTWHGMAFIDLQDGVRSPVWVGGLIASGCFALVGLAVFLPMSRGPRTMARAAIFAGGVSYPLYLVHQVVGLTLSDLFAARLPDTLAVMLALLCIGAIAASVHVAVERRARPRLRAAIARRLGAG